MLIQEGAKIDPGRNYNCSFIIVLALLILPFNSIHAQVDCQDSILLGEADALTPYEKVNHITSVNSNPDSAEVNLQDQNEEVLTRQNRVETNYYEGNYTEVISDCLFLKDIFQVNKDYNRLGDTYFLMAEAYAKMDSDSLSEYYYQQAILELYRAPQSNWKMVRALIKYSDLINEANQLFEDYCYTAEFKFKGEKDIVHLAHLYRILANYFNSVQNHNEASRYFEMAANIEMESNGRDENYPLNRILEAINLVENGKYVAAEEIHHELIQYNGSIDPGIEETFLTGMCMVHMKFVNSKDGRIPAVQYLLSQIFEAKTTTLKIAYFELLFQLNPGEDFQSLISDPLHQLEEELNGKPLPQTLQILAVMIGLEDTISDENEGGDLISSIGIMHERTPLLDDEIISLAAKIGSLLLPIGEFAEDHLNVSEISGFLNHSAIQDRFEAELLELNEVARKLIELLINSQSSESFIDQFELSRHYAPYWEVLYGLGLFYNDADLMIFAFESGRNYSNEEADKIQGLYADHNVWNEVKRRLNSQDLLIGVSMSNISEKVSITAITAAGIQYSSVAYSLILEASAEETLVSNQLLAEAVNRGMSPVNMTAQEARPMWQATDHIMALTEDAKAFNEMLYTYRSLLGKEIKSANELDFIKWVSSLLYHHLFKFALGDEKNVRNIIISANGQLSMIPMEVLLDSQGDYLIEKFNISYTSSLLLNENGPKDTTKRVNMLAGINDFEEINTTRLSPCPETFVSENSMRAWLVKSVDQGLPISCHFANYQFMPLQGVARELAILDSILSPGIMLNNELAREAAMKKAFDENGPFNIIHIATHAIFDPLLPELSTLVLNAGYGDDGYLSLLEIAQSDIDADLVVLSACETNLGFAYEYSGSLGLPSAFLNAGVSHVISSQWKVDDLGTKEFMEEFYTNWNLNHDMEFEHPLRSTKLNFINGDHGMKYSDPYYWASFVITK